MSPKCKKSDIILDFQYVLLLPDLFIPLRSLPGGFDICSAVLLLPRFSMLISQVVLVVIMIFDLCIYAYWRINSPSGYSFKKHANTQRIKTPPLSYHKPGLSNTRPESTCQISQTVSLDSFQKCEGGIFIDFTVSQ